MVRPEAKLEILRLVARHDGEWYWYQVDRALSGRLPNVFGPFIEEIKSLLSEGSLEERVNPTIDDKPRYWITDAGKASLEMAKRPDSESSE